LEVLVVWSFVYLALRRILELMVLCWRSFRRQQAAGILACDFPDRGHRVPAAAVRAVLHSAADPARPADWRHRPPTGAWVAQQARNLLATSTTTPRPSDS
jgi:hypothetical protein